MNVLDLYLRLSSGGSPNDLTLDAEVKVLGSKPIKVRRAIVVTHVGKMLDTELEAELGGTTIVVRVIHHWTADLKVLSFNPI